MLNNLVYLSPQKDFAIVKKEYVPFQTITYYVCKKMGDDKWIVLIGDIPIEQCYRWLFKMNIISKDEMLEQITLERLKKANNEPSE